MGTCSILKLWVCSICVLELALAARQISLAKCPRAYHLNRIIGSTSLCTLNLRKDMRQSIAAIQSGFSICHFTLAFPERRIAGPRILLLAGLAIAPTFEYTLGLRDAYDSHSYSIDFVVGVMSQGYIILYLHLFTFTGLCGSFAHYVFNLVIFLIVDVELFSNGGASASIQVIQQIGVCTWRMRPAKPLQFPEITPQMGP